MITKIRKFKLEPAGATISKDGEFIHINDIVLALKEERESLNSMLEMNKSRTDDWGEKYGYALEQKIELITNLIKHVCYGDKSERRSRRRVLLGTSRRDVRSTTVSELMSSTVRCEHASRKKSGKSDARSSKKTSLSMN